MRDRGDFDPSNWLYAGTIPDMWITGVGADQEFSLGLVTFEMLRRQLDI